MSCLESCTCTTESGKNAKCTEAYPECYETFHIHSMCQNGCPYKNSSGNLFPNSGGLRSRPCRALKRARARRCRARTQNAPRPYQNAMKLCTSILCVKMGVRAKIHREILSLTRVASVPVRVVPGSVHVHDGVGQERKMHRGLSRMLRNFAHPFYVSKWVSMQKFIGKFFP